MRFSPARHRLALATALVGVALSTLTLVVHQRIGAGYTSFCNLGEVVNCDAVLGSRYGHLLGISVAAWGLAAFAIGLLLALPGALGWTTAGLADLGLLGLVSGSLGFACVLAVAALGVLHRVCLLCLGLDLVILVWFVTVLPLATRFEPATVAEWWRRRTMARSIAAAAALLAIAGGTWAAVRAPESLITVAEVREKAPRFYTWYTHLPVRAVADLTEGATHTRGPATSPLLIVAFSDFQCPYCVRAFRDLRDLIHDHPDIRLVFRHFPLDPSCNGHVTRSVHPNACLAAIAAECAAQQDRFWEYHDLLFENNEHLERESLFGYARDLHLDIPTFRTCLDEPATRTRIGADVEAGARMGVASTPTLFINGRAVEGALERPYYDYALIIEQHDRETPRDARKS